MKQENIIDLTEILKPYTGKHLWVALDEENKIVALN